MVGSDFWPVFLRFGQVEVIEVDQLPVHGPDFAASLGSLLVIHKPNDARKFVPDLFKKRRLDQSQGSAGVDCKEFPIRWFRVNLGRCSWSLRCCMFASWILLNAGCFFVKECRRSRLFSHLFTRHPVTHAIFNLPAMGVELLDCFRGLDYVKQNLPRPLVPRSAFSSCTVRQSHEVIWVISN